MTVQPVLIHRDLLRMYSEPCRAHFANVQTNALVKSDFKLPVSYSTIKKLSELCYNMPVTFTTVKDIVEVIKAIAFLMLPKHLADRVARKAVMEIDGPSTERLTLEAVSNYNMLYEAFHSHKLEFPSEITQNLTFRAERYVRDNLAQSAVASLALPQDIWQGVIENVVRQAACRSDIYLKLLPVVPDDLVNFLIKTLVSRSKDAYWLDEMIMILKDLQMRHPAAYNSSRNSFADQVVDLYRFRHLYTDWQKVTLDRIANVDTENVQVEDCGPGNTVIIFGSCTPDRTICSFECGQSRNAFSQTGVFPDPHYRSCRFTSAYSASAYSAGLDI